MKVLDKVIRQFKYNQEDPNSLANNYISSLHKDSKNRLWIATKDGMNMLDLNQSLEKTQFLSFKYIFQDTLQNWPGGIQMRAIEKSIQQEQEKEKVHIKEIFKKNMCLVIVVGIIVAIFQQLVGINSVMFYAPMIFEQTGIGTDASFLQAILVGLVNLVFTVLAMFIIDRLGRKPMLIYGMIGWEYLCYYLLTDLK